MNDVLAEDALAEGGTAVAEAPPPDGEGLQGYNPSDGEAPLGKEEGDEEKTFPENPDDTPAGPDPDEEEHEPTAEEETIVEPSAEEREPEIEPEEIAEEPEGQVEPPAAAKKPKSKSRVYLVFEEHGRGDPSYKRVPECLYTGAEQIKLKEANEGVKDYEVPTGELVSRNGDNALRAAYRRLAAARENEDLKVTLVIVAESSWRPKPIKPRQRNLPPAIEIG